MGRRRPANAAWTYESRCSSVGWRRFHRSTSSPSRRKLREARHAPDVALDSEIGREQVGSGHHLAQDHAGAEQLHPRPFAPPLTQPVEAAQDALLDALGHRRLDVVLVHHRQVVEDVLLLLAHAPQAVPDDHGELVGVRRVVGTAVRHDRREQMRVPVLVLEPFAVQRRAPRGGADQEAPRAAVTRRPGEVADALEPEHRIEDVEREPS